MEANELREIVGRYFKPHPWHGITPGAEAPEKVQAYIEIVPTDTVKFEIDKASGILKLDRPQRFSSLSPTLYGFIPRTYCGPLVGHYCAERSGWGVRGGTPPPGGVKEDIVGDGDPLDICVITEKAVMHGDILVRAVPIGGLRLIDSNQADDKIISVLEGDIIFGGISDITELQDQLVDRLVHYFLSYKDLPGEGGRVRARKVECEAVFGRREAHRVIELALEDYRNTFGDPEARLGRLLKELAD
ncbi:MAG: inorganic pyrophosphatase [Candidatus Eremiobacterota bacterium]